MAGPNLIGIAALVFVLTADYVISVTSAACTNDCTPFIPGAVAFWPFNAEMKGADLSGNGNHATLVGLTYTEGPSGVASGGLHFHGNASNESYAWVSMSPSLEVGKYSGFSVCGFVRFPTDMVGVPIIDARNTVIYGWNVFAHPLQNLYLSLYTPDKLNHGYLPTLNFTTGSWRFFGVSYEKTTGKVSGFMDGQREERYVGKNIIAYTKMTKRIAFGRSYLPNRKVFKGDMSCMMLFRVGLRADDFERIWKFCRTMISTQIEMPNITVTDITPTSARASWTESPGTFARYFVTIERKQGGSGQEAVKPSSLSSSIAFPEVSLANLVPGASYQIHVWHMQGSIKGRARSSQWFETKLPPVEMDTIIFSMITATSAKVAWKAVTSQVDGYVVYLSPTAGGAKADPSTVPRGTVTTSLMNLIPGSYYTITIRTMAGTSFSSPSTTTFQTKDQQNPESQAESPIAVAGLAVAVICLFVIVVFIAVVCVLVRKIDLSSTSNGDAREVPMSNLGFQPDVSPRSDTRSNEENYNPYEVPDRRNIEENTPGPLYVNVTRKENSDYETLNVTRT